MITRKYKIDNMEDNKDADNNLIWYAEDIVNRLIKQKSIERVRLVGV